MTARIAYEVHEGETEPVLAIHGISSQRRLWTWLRAAAPALTIVAVDLRGRGGSVDAGAPYGLATHADDVVAVLDDLGLDEVHVCGMSMGGFVAVDLATRHRARVKSLILVDGGFPMATPPGLTKELVPTVFADRLGRLAKPWASLEEYLDYFVTNTAPLLDRDDPLLRHYLEHDLGGDGRVRLSGDALVADAEDAFFGDVSWERIPLDVPVRFAHAEWSTGEGTAPAYSAEAVERYSRRAVATRFIAGADHAASIMSPAGAAATAALIRDALSSSA